MTTTPSLDTWTCPLPLRTHANIVLGHGGGGKLSAELVHHLFLPAFRNDALAALGDSAVLSLPGARLAFSTDSFVVQPLFFPGGNIGDLAVNGTVNDIAMSGAQPLFMSTGFILEEGLPLETLGTIVQAMATAARFSGISLVTGDTKVVGIGHGDGVYINTSAIGIIPSEVTIAPDQARPGDVVIVSGEIGLHGIAVMSVRAGLNFDTVVLSDCAPLNGLVAAMLEVTKDIHTLRDPNAGGVTSALNEIAKASHVGIALDERAIPIPDAVRSACEMLGLDPLYVANEGKLLAIVPRRVAEPLLECMRQHPAGRHAAMIGQATDHHRGMVVARTGIGGSRVVDMQVGEQLPRIC